MSGIAKAKVCIVNRLGMHARPAMCFVECASTFNSKINVRKGTQSVDGKSIMQIMMLAATAGTELEIEADGDDADDAIKALTDLVNRGFDEE